MSALFDRSEHPRPGRIFTNGQDGPIEYLPGVIDEAEPEQDVPESKDASAEEAPELSDLEREVLDLEAQRWKYRGAKEKAIRALMERHGFMMTREGDRVYGSPVIPYYLRLNALIDNPAAIAYKPILLEQLRKNRHR